MVGFFKCFYFVFVFLVFCREHAHKKNEEGKTGSASPSQGSSLPSVLDAPDDALSSSTESTFSLKGLLDNVATVYVVEGKDEDPVEGSLNLTQGLVSLIKQDFPRKFKLIWQKLLSVPWCNAFA